MKTDIELLNSIADSGSVSQSCHPSANIGLANIHFKVNGAAVRCLFSQGNTGLFYVEVGDMQNFAKILGKESVKE
jgi:hypothetical protein